MSPPNPFIELARDPVATLGWLGYVFLITTTTVFAAGYAARMATELWATADRTARQRDWYGDTLDGWLPPTQWTLGAAKLTIALTVAAWAVASLVWIASGV
jgi:hypothetical protein